MGAVIAGPAVGGGSPARAYAEASRSDQRSMVLEVAAAGSVFPVRLQTQSATPAARAAAIRRWARQRSQPTRTVLATDHRTPSMDRLLTAESALSPADLALARAGADGLIAAGLSGAGPAAIIGRIGRRSRLAPADERDALRATARLAVITVFPASASTAGAVAQRWIDLLVMLDKRGALQSTLRQRGIQ